jgi:hypothetical protein
LRDVSVGGATDSALMLEARLVMVANAVRLSVKDVAVFADAVVENGLAFTRDDRL